MQDAPDTAVQRRPPILQYLAGQCSAVGTLKGHFLPSPYFDSSSQCQHASHDAALRPVPAPPLQDRLVPCLNAFRYPTCHLSTNSSRHGALGATAVISPTQLPSVHPSPDGTTVMTSQTAHTGCCRDCLQLCDPRVHRHTTHLVISQKTPEDDQRTQRLVSRRTQPFNTSTCLTGSSAAAQPLLGGVRCLCQGVTSCSHWCTTHLVVCVQDGAPEERGCLPLTHLQVEALPQIGDGAPPPEAGQAAVLHQGHRGHDALCHTSRLQAAERDDVGGCGWAWLPYAVLCSCGTGQGSRYGLVRLPHAESAAVKTAEAVCLRCTGQVAGTTGGQRPAALRGRGAEAVTPSALPVLAGERKLLRLCGAATPRVAQEGHAAALWTVGLDVRLPDTSQCREAPERLWPTGSSPRKEPADSPTTLNAGEPHSVCDPRAALTARNPRTHRSWNRWN